MWIYDNNGAYIGFTYNGVEYYYVYNLQHDVEAITDSTGAIVAKYGYDTWGEVQYEANYNGTVNIAVINPIRYRGYYYDSERGLYYLNSRYYDPFMCRFLNADGYVSTGQGVTGFNMFAYCGNNPVNRADPSGESAVLAGLLIGFLVEVVCGLTVIACVYIITDALVRNPPAIPSISSPKTDSKTKEKDKADEGAGTQTIPRKSNDPVIFPENPSDFNPIGLVKIPRVGTKNGSFFSWMDPTTNTEVFRWDENPNYSNGPHYHIYGTGHYTPGVDIVPEPYASRYFPIT